MPLTGSPFASLSVPRTHPVVSSTAQVADATITVLDVVVGTGEGLGVGVAATAPPAPASTAPAAIRAPVSAASSVLRERLLEPISAFPFESEAILSYFRRSPGTGTGPRPSGRAPGADEVSP